MICMELLYRYVQWKIQLTDDLRLFDLVLLLGLRGCYLGVWELNAEGMGLNLDNLCLYEK